MAEKSKAQAALARLQKINPGADFMRNHSLSRVDEWIDTGSMGLNAIVSGSLYGGVPMGKIVQFCGESQTFKSGFSAQIMANAQKIGKVVLLFDTEGAYTEEGAKSFGLKSDELILMKCESIEQVRNDIFKFLKDIPKEEHGLYVVVIDSLANLQSEMELKRMDKDSTSADMGSAAKAIKSLLKTCTNSGNSTNTAFIITNHVYDDPSEKYPSLEKNINGGKAAVFLPTVTVQLSRKVVKEGADSVIDDKKTASQKNATGIILRAMTAKNRIIQQYLETEVYLSFSKGMNKYYGLDGIMKELGIIENSGASYTDWEGNKLGFRKNWFSDKKLWEERFLPELEKRIKENWSYSSVSDEDEEEFLETSEEVEDDS